MAFAPHLCSRPGTFEAPNESSSRMPRGIVHVPGIRDGFQETRLQGPGVLKTEDICFVYGSRDFNLEGNLIRSGY